MEHPQMLFTEKTHERLLAALERPPVDQVRLDVAVRVMVGLGFKPDYVVEWFPALPLENVRAYFKGELIREEHLGMMRECAWQVVYAAQEMLLQASLDNPDLTTDKRWLAFSRRIFESGVALDKGVGDA